MQRHCIIYYTCKTSIKLELKWPKHRTPKDSTRISKKKLFQLCVKWQFSFLKLLFFSYNFDQKKRLLKNKTFPPTFRGEYVVPIIFDFPGEYQLFRYNFFSIVLQNI